MCDQISDSLPGIGYVTVDGIAEPVRVRFSHVTDDYIMATVVDVMTGPLLALKAGQADETERAA